MSFKKSVAVFGLATTLATVGFTALGPHEPQTAEQRQQQQSRQEVHDYGENDKKVKGDLRQQGDELADSVREDELRPREVRTVKRLPFRAP